MDFFCRDLPFQRASSIQFTCSVDSCSMKKAHTNENKYDDCLSDNYT